MFGVVPRTIWSGWTEPDEYNRIRLDCNCVLLEDGEHVVLVEAGYGSKWTAKERGLYAMEERSVVDALAEIEVDPSTITHVILSHLHFDHAGALTTWRDPGLGEAGGLDPTFPNARIIVQRQELEDASSNRSTMTRTYLRSHLDPVADRFDVVDGTAEPLPGIVLRPAPGHTWGQQSIEWSDAERDLVFPGDLCPTRLHAHPSTSMAYDMEPWTSLRGKQALLRRCADEGRLIVLDHDPDEPLARALESPERPGRHVLEPVHGL